MSDIDDLLTNELRKLPAKPLQNAKQTEKKRYSELMSASAARAFAEALRRKGLDETLPDSPAKPAPVASAKNNSHDDEEVDQ